MPGGAILIDETGRYLLPCDYKIVTAAARDAANRNKRSRGGAVWDDLANEIYLETWDHLAQTMARQPDAPP